MIGRRLPAFDHPMRQKGLRGSGQRRRYIRTGLLLSPVQCSSYGAVREGNVPHREAQQIAGPQHRVDSNREQSKVVKSFPSAEILYQLSDLDLTESRSRTDRPARIPALDCHEKERQKGAFLTRRYRRARKYQKRTYATDNVQKNQ